jgi:hypothetical protein
MESVTGRPNIMPSRPKNEAAVRRELRRRIAALGRGGTARIADEIGISDSRISGVARGNYPVTDRIAKGLGFRRVVRWERLK